MKTNRASVTALLLALFLAWQPATAQYKTSIPGYRYEFPRDYFNHPDFQTEWWYYTGNLRDISGRRFGFELTFFRSAVSRDPSPSPSWGVQDLYFAHFALSDLDGERFFHAERTNRAGPGIAGIDPAQQKIWNGNWSVVWASGRENLTAITADFEIHLSLESQKPPVIHGENGVSQKSAGAGRASHYFSETRLRASGSLAIKGNVREVSGQAWMDHEFFTEQLSPEQTGWDWLSLQLNDNTEVMLFHIRRKDGSVDAHSAGTYVDAQGHSRHLAISDFSFEPTGDAWQSPTTRATYPIGWNMAIPSLGIMLNAITLLPSQELSGKSSLAPSYWEGAIVLSGTKNGSPLQGSGYLEMTGYDRPVQTN